MRLALGPRGYDLTTRALVVATVEVNSSSLSDRPAFELDHLLHVAERGLTEGADVLAVGAGRRPLGAGADATAEDHSLITLVDVVSQRFDVPVAVETCRAEVARQAFAAGADLVIDTSGFVDPELLDATAGAGATVAVTHAGAVRTPARPSPSPPTPKPARPTDGSPAVLSSVCGFLLDRARAATEAGITADRIVVDAGLDAGKPGDQALELLRASDRLSGLGYPLMVSVSDATWLASLRGGQEVGNEQEALIALAALGTTLGGRLVRTRHVKSARRVCDVVTAILEAP